LDGIGGVRYDIADVEQFLDAFEPLFDPENIASSPIGRSLTSQTWLHNRPIGEVVYELTGQMTSASRSTASAPPTDTTCQKGDSRARSR
jgi:hypothetical protein